MIARKNLVAAVFLCTATFVLLLLWNLNQQRDPYVKLLDTSDVFFDENASEGEKLFDLNFEYIFNSKTCEGKNHTKYLAVIIVTSHVSNVERRSAMRRAFSDGDLEGFRLRRVFLLGTVPNNAYITQNSVGDEARRFDDLVQGNFKEAYRNLTYKHVMGLRWVTRHCSNVKYIIKMDDDIVFDLYRTVELLKTIKLPSSNYVGGYILKGMAPIREPANKWYTTSEEYGASRYPTFVSGWLYITTAEFCSGISSLSRQESYFWIDDVYVTGILAQKLGVRFLNLNRYYAVHAELMQCCLRDLAEFECDFLFGPNGGNDEMFYTFNALATKCLLKKCPVRQKPLNVSCVASRNINLGRGYSIVQPYKLT